MDTGHDIKKGGMGVNSVNILLRKVGVQELTERILVGYRCDA